MKLLALENRNSKRVVGTTMHELGSHQRAENSVMNDLKVIVLTVEFRASSFTSAMKRGHGSAVA